MGRELKLAVPKLPSKIPGQDMFEKTTLILADKLTNSTPMRLLDALMDKVPYPQEMEISTPFGDVRVPPLNLPRVKMPDLTDERKMEAVRAAVGGDISSLAQFIPFVGQYVAEPLCDTFSAKLQETLHPEEYTMYKRWEKKSPLSVIAVIQTFIRER